MIRMRDADKNGYCTCVTCGKKDFWTCMDGGHFIPSTYLATCFDEDNVSSQCKRCNNWLEGSRETYFTYLERKLGRKKLDELIARKNTPTKYTESDYNDMIKSFRSRQDKYREEKCL